MASPGASGQEAPPVDAAASLAALEAGFADVRQDHGAVRGEIEDLVRVSLDLQPELLLPGERVALTIEARSEAPPNADLEVLEGCYAEDPTVHEFRLRWQRAESGAYRATWNWRPPRAGSYLLRWECDIGGDVPVFTRNFAVVDGSWTVFILNSTSHIDPRPEPDFHELRLPFSYWAESLLYGRRPTAEAFVAFSRNARQFGDDPGLLIFLGGDYLPDHQIVLYDEPEPVQRRVLELYRELWEMCEMPRPAASLYTYGMGNGPVRVARELGFGLLGALCADQNWGDGPFKINHWGMPARPYFVSPEDFRKPGPGGPEAMVGVQQCERLTVPCRDYDCVYAFEAGIEYGLALYSGINRPRVVDEVALSREIDFLHCFVAAAKAADTPYMASLGFEFNGVWPHSAEFNRTMMETIAGLAADSPVSFTTASAAADFMRRHYDAIPETVLYLPDVYAGITRNGKPVNYPDTLEIENAELRAIFRHGETLPYAQYDYAAEWGYPDWGNEDIPREPTGYVIPDTDDRFRVTPSIVDTRAFRIVRVEQSEEAGGTRVDLRIQAERAVKRLALAVWDIPRAHSPRPKRYRLGGATRFVPVKAPYTGNLCGIIVADLERGENLISLLVKTARREPISQDVALAPGAAAKVFERADATTAYVFATGHEPVNVALRLPDGAEGKRLPPDSDEPVPLAGLAEFSVEPGLPHKLVGLTREQLAAAVGGE